MKNIALLTCVLVYSNFSFASSANPNSAQSLYYLSCFETTSENLTTIVNNEYHSSPGKTLFSKYLSAANNETTPLTRKRQIIHIKDVEFKSDSNSSLFVLPSTDSIDEAKYCRIHPIAITMNDDSVLVADKYLHILAKDEQQELLADVQTLAEKKIHGLDSSKQLNGLLEIYENLDL